VGHADRRLAEALKFGLEPVLGPPEPERLTGLAPQPTLRKALGAALAKASSRAAA
jgi:hypothetical protein